jgi:SIT family siderophore-iron:H+ symporter-like MFS transporter
VLSLQAGIGTAIGGAIWTNIVPGKINEYFTTVANGTVLGRAAYSDPFTFALEHPIGTPERAAIARAQDEAQRIIVIVGTVICALGLLVSIFIITNVRLPDTQSIEENEEEAERLAQEKAARNQKVVSKL